MFKIFYKDIKTIEKLLPKTLNLDSYLEFCAFEFSNVGTNSKFIFEKEKLYIAKIGISYIGNVTILRLYLKGVEHQDAYILLEYIEEELVNTSLFINYDCVYLKNPEEQLYWLGKKALSKGIMNSSTFIIDEEPLERIGGILCKIALGISGTLSYAEQCIFQEEDSYVSTDLLEKLADLEKVEYSKIRKIFEEKLEEEDWLLDIQKEDEKTAFYYNFINEELKIEYYKNFQEYKEEHREKIYKIQNGKKIFHKTINRKNTLYSRAIDDEFFEEEYISLNYENKEQLGKIVIDLGIPLKLRDILIGKEVIEDGNRGKHKS